MMVVEGQSTGLLGPKSLRVTSRGAVSVGKRKSQNESAQRLSRTNARLENDFSPKIVPSQWTRCTHASLAHARHTHPAIAHRPCPYDVRAYSFDVGGFRSSGILKCHLIGLLRRLPGAVGPLYLRMYCQ